MKLNQSGMSLAELLVALAIGSMTVLVAVGFLIYMIKNFSRFGQDPLLSLDAASASDYFTEEILNLGGLQIRPWTAFALEDDCNARANLPACNGSDRLTFAQLPAVPPVCTVDSLNGNTITLVRAVGDPCCVTNAWLNNQVMVVGAQGAASRFVSAVDTGTCQIQTQMGQLRGLTFEAEPVLTPAQWRDAALIPVIVSTYYLDNPNRSIRMWRDSNGNGTMQADESQIVFIDVIDLQAAIFFESVDSPPNFLDTGNNLDSWLFNSPAESLGVGGLLNAQASGLRMIDIRMIFGSQSQSPNRVMSLQAHNGPVRNQPDMSLKMAKARAAPRSIEIFQ